MHGASACCFSPPAFWIFPTLCCTSARKRRINKSLLCFVGACGALRNYLHFIFLSSLETRCRGLHGSRSEKTQWPARRSKHRRFRTRSRRKRSGTGSSRGWQWTRSGGSRCRQRTCSGRTGQHQRTRTGSSSSRHATGSTGQQRTHRSSAARSGPGCASPAPQPENDGISAGFERTEIGNDVQTHGQPARHGLSAQ